MPQKTTIFQHLKDVHKNKISFPKVSQYTRKLLK